MTNRRLALAAVASCAAWIFFPAVPGARAEERLPFAPGETLTYDMSWSVFPAGQVQVEYFGPVKSSNKSYVVKATAQSSGYVSIIYKVQDEFRSIFGPEPLCSHQISKTVNEGRRHKSAEIHFDYGRKVAILDESDPSKQNTPEKHEENEISACVQDVVSAFYYLRAQPMKVGQHLQLDVNDGGKTSEVDVEVQGREQIKTGIGTRTALRVEPKVFGKLFKKKGRMLIWFSDDAQRLPLRVKMFLSFGSIVGTLSSVTSTTDAAP